MNKRRWTAIVLIVSLVLILTPIELMAALPPRVVWEYSSTQSYTGFLSLTAQGTLMATQNGAYDPKVLELNNKGEILWEYGPIQANSAVVLTNGNVLIADSGAPGYPMKPRILEVDRQGQILWSYELPHRGDSPRLAVEVAGGRYLVVLPDRVVEIDRQGKVYWEYGGLLYPVWAQRLDNGNTLIVDRGFYGGKVLEVSKSGDEAWSYGDYGSPGQAGLLSRPVWATRLPDGDYLISDRGRARLLKIAGQEAEVVNQWQEVLNALPVADRWVAVPDLANDQIYLSLTLTSGRSVIWQVDREIKTLVRGEPVKFQTPPVLLDGVLYGGARELLELVGAKINWKADTKELEIFFRDQQAVVCVDSSEGWVDGERVYLEPPKIHGGTAMLPLAFMRDYFGLDYRWDPAARELDFWL